MSDEVEVKHGKVREFIEQEDGSVLIETRSYHERLIMIKREIVHNIMTNNANLLADVVSCLDVLKGQGTPELTITIRSEGGIPKMISKTYVKSTERLGGREK